MSPIFLWTLADSKEMMSVLWWSKVVILIHGQWVTSFSVAPDAHMAREVALRATEEAEHRDMWLIGLNAAPGWNDLPTSISCVHQLFILGRQEQALAVMVDSIMKAVVEEGESFDV